MTSPDLQQEPHTLPDGCIVMECRRCRDLDTNCTESISTIFTTDLETAANFLERHASHHLSTRYVRGISPRVPLLLLNIAQVAAITGADLPEVQGAVASGLLKPYTVFDTKVFRMMDVLAWRKSVTHMRRCIRKLQEIISGIDKAFDCLCQGDGIEKGLDKMREALSPFFDEDADRSAA